MEVRVPRPRKDSHSGALNEGAVLVAVLRYTCITALLLLPLGIPIQFPETREATP